MAGRNRKYISKAVNTVINVLISPKEHMTKIILGLLILSVINVIFSGGDRRLMIGLVTLMVVCGIYSAVKKNNEGKCRPHLDFAVSVMVLANFSIFFLMTFRTIGNVWLEEISARVFIFTVMMVIGLFLTYRADEYLKDRCNRGTEKDKNKTRTE